MRGFVLVLLFGVLTSGCGEKAQAAQRPPPPPRPAAEIDAIVATAEAQYAKGEYEAARKALYALHEELKSAGSPKTAEVNAALEKAACGIQLPDAAAYLKAWPAKRRSLEKESQDGSTYTQLLVDLTMGHLYLNCIEKSPADVVTKLIPKQQRAPALLKTVTQELARFDAKADKIQAYFDSCGKKPQRWFDGGVIAAQNLMKQTAHDPDSIDVENCTEPMLMTRGCWQYTCEVRGKNAYGAMVLNRVTFHEDGKTIRSR